MPRFPHIPDRRPRRTRLVVASIAGTAVLLAASCGGGSKQPEVSADTEAPVSTTSSIEPSTTTASTTSISSTTTLSSTTTTAAPPRLNIYAGTATTNPVTAGHRFLVYVPHEVGNVTTVIDPTTMRVIDRFTTGPESHHVVPSWDMKTLYVIASRGDLITPIDPVTGKPGTAIPVEDPYNLYFLPDGSEAIVVEEANQTLTFRDPHTFEFHSSTFTSCYGVNHLDFALDGSYLIASCEFEGTLIKFDLRTRKVVGEIPIDMTPTGKTSRIGRAQPQDVRLSADGSVFFVADLQSDGVYLIDGGSFTQVGFIPAGVGAHGLYPSRDGTKLYVINRGTNIVGGPPKGKGSVTVIDMATRTVEANWPIPGGGSPDMGNLTPDGSQLWLGGRYDSEVYVFDTRTGGLIARIPVGSYPHGLTVWPQPGRYSLGHTGNMR